MDGLTDGVTHGDRTGGRASGGVQETLDTTSWPGVNHATAATRGDGGLAMPPEPAPGNGSGLVSAYSAPTSQLDLWEI